MRVCYLCCRDTLSSAPNRRGDAFEHDREFFPLKAAFEKAGDTLFEADWRSPLPDADLYFIRTLWDYPEHDPEFRAFINRPDLKGRLANDPKIIKANLSKRYLIELAAAGIPIIPSYFVEEPVTAEQLWSHFNDDDIVLKPIVGAGGDGQKRLQKGQSDPEMRVETGQLAQPFFKEIHEVGELSLIYFNGVFSHACRKLNPTGDYRIQSLYGGVEEAYIPDSREIDLGLKLIASLPATPLACRVDLLPTKKGPLLMELEAIEPYLYPDFCEDFGKHLHRAIRDYVTNSSPG